MASKGVCVLRGAFVNGKVKILEHASDFPPVHPDALDAVKTGTAKDGELKLDGLEVGKSYWACQEVDGEWRCRTFAAHDPSVYVSPKGTKPQYTGEIPSGYSNNSIEGARNASAKPEAHGQSKNPEQAPFHDVADVSEPKLSETAMGEGHPAPPEEQIPPLPTESAATLEELEGEKSVSESRSKAAKKAAATKAKKAKARSAAAKKAAATRKRNAAKKGAK